MRLNQEKIERMFNARGSMAGGGGGGSESIAGLASQVWTEENYVSKAFFNELFIIHKKTTTTVYDGDVVVSTTVDTSGVFSPNEVPSQTESTDAQTGYRTVVETEVDNIEAKKGLWTDYFLSALGLNSSGGGGGSDTLAGLLDVELDSPVSNQMLTYYNGKWRNMSAPGVDMNAVWQALGDTTTTQQIAHSHLTTALNGYATQLWVGQQGFLTSADLSGYATQLWVTNNFSTPSTVATQMQTYAKIQNGTITIGDASLTPITSVGGTFWGNSWTNGGTVTGSLTGVVQIDMTGHLVMHSGGTGIYLNSDGTGIDWHNAAGEYVSSLIAFTSAQVQINQDLYIPSPKIVRIGDAVLVWDGDNNALKLRHASGANASVNFYATGGVSALGYSDSGGGGGGGDVTWELLASNADTRPIALSHLTGALAGYATTSQLAGYLPLTAGSTKKLTGVLYTNKIINLGDAANDSIRTRGIEGEGPQGNGVLGDLYLQYSNNGHVLICAGETQGNVGVGTDNPSYKLDVSGSIRYTNALVSTVATGTAPFTITSTTLNTNLNADLLDGQHGSYYAAASALGDYLPLIGGVLTGSLTVPTIFLKGDKNKIWSNANNQDIVISVNNFNYIVVDNVGRSVRRGDDQTNNDINLGLSQYPWNNVYANGFYKNSSDNTYVLLGGGGHAAISSLVVGSASSLSQSTITNLNSFLYSTYLIYAAAGGDNTVSNKPTGVDAFGVLSFKNADGWQAQILYASNEARGLYIRTALSSTWYDWLKVLDSGNSSVSLSGETLSVKINDTTCSLTNTWRGIQNNLTSSSTTDSLSAYQGYLLANGYARDDTKVPMVEQTEVNLNTVYNTSIIQTLNGSNAPSTYTTGVMLTMAYRKHKGNTSPDFASQIYIPAGNDTTKPNSMFYRTSISNSWNRWNEVMTLQNYSEWALPLSGGTMTGGITMNDNYLQFTSGSIYSTYIGIYTGFGPYIRLTNSSIDNYIAPVSENLCIGSLDGTKGLAINTPTGTARFSYRLGVGGSFNDNYMLTVVGNGYFRNSLYTNKIINYGGADDNAIVTRGLNGSDGGGANGDLYVNHYHNGVVVLCCGGGSVGINTASPSYKLHVAGTMYASNDAIFDGNVTTTSIELNARGTLSGYGGFIDFHYNGSSADYTSRIVEDASGRLYLSATNGVRIGDAVLRWESGNNALRIESPTGGAVNLYTTGGLSALGISGAADGTVNASLIPSTTGTYTLGNTSYRWKELYLASTNGSYNGRIYVDYDGINLDSANGGWFGGSRYMIEGRLVIGTQTDDQPNYDLYVAGNTYVDGTNAYFYGNVSVQSLTQRSDMRIKDVISDMTLKISTIAQAPLFKYKLKQGDGTIMVGSSAQYWDALLPEVIHRDADGILGLDYGVTALASVISVAKEVTEHERRIARLEAENAILRAQIEDLKAA